MALPVFTPVDAAPHVKDLYSDLLGALSKDQNNAELEEACTEGELHLVEDRFTSMRERDGAKFDPRTLQNSLHNAVQGGHRLVAEYLLSQGVPINRSTVELAINASSISMLDLFVANGWDINKEPAHPVPPPLALAVDDEKLTSWFLSKGAHPNAICGLGISPLSAAVQFAPFAIIKLLFDSGGSIKVGQLLHYAVRREGEDSLQVLRFILDKGPSVNDVMYQNRLNSYQQMKAFGLGTALHEAAGAGKVQAVQLLLEHGADPLIRDSLGRTPLTLAEANGHLAVVEILRPITATAPAPEKQFTG